MKWSEHVRCWIRKSHFVNQMFPLDIPPQTYARQSGKTGLARVIVVTRIVFIANRGEDVLWKNWRRGGESGGMGVVAVEEVVTGREIGVRGSAKLLIVHPATLQWTFILDQRYHIILDCLHAWREGQINRSGGA